MFLCFDEYGGVVYTHKMTDEMKMAVDYGTLTVIRIDGDLPMVYDAGKWHRVREEKV